MLARAALLSVLLCCSAAAEPRAEALAVVARWAEAFSSSDVDTIVGLHADDALFFGTSSEALVIGHDGIRRYFERSLLQNRPRGARLGEHSVTVASDSTVVVTGLDTVTGVRAGVPFETGGRVTFVIAKRGEEWRIVHFHRSAALQTAAPPSSTR